MESDTHGAPLAAVIREIGWKGVVRIVAMACGVDPYAVVGRKHRPDAYWARQLVYLVLYEQAGWKMSTIGRVLGRDRTTVHHGVRAAQARRETAQGQAAWVLVLARLTARARQGR